MFQVPTYGVGLSVVRGHHQRGGVCVGVGRVHQRPLGEQQGHTLHVVGERRRMQGGPGEHTHIVCSVCVQGCVCVCVCETSSMSHLPLASMTLMIVGPRETMSISATPSLSFMLKHTHTHTRHTRRHNSQPCRLSG